MFFLELCQLGMVTNALALSTDKKVAKGSAGLSLLLPVRPFAPTPNVSPLTIFSALIMLSHSPTGAPFAGKTTCSFAMSPHRNVSSLFGFLQSHGCPHAPHHQPTTHAVSLSSSSMVGGDPPEGVAQWEQLAMFTDISERDGSSSFCFSHLRSGEVRALPHDILGVDVSRLHVLQHLVPEVYQ